MKQHIETIKNVLENGTLRPDRTGVGRLSIFGAREVYDIRDNKVPMVTTRRMYTKAMMQEIIGMIGGYITPEKLGKSFWDKWALSEEFVRSHANEQLDIIAKDEPGAVPKAEERKPYLDQLVKSTSTIGTIGPMYGALWRQWPLTGGRGDFTWINGYEDIPSDFIRRMNIEFDRQVALHNGQLKNDKETRQAFIGDQYVKSIDQLNKLLLQLKRNPFSSHHRITAFDPSLVGPHANPQLNVLEGYGALSPCHTFFQFYVSEIAGEKYLSCQLYMGSSDVCLGRPYNVAFYSILTMMMAHCLDYKPLQFILVSGDTHIYANHIEQAKEQVKIVPLVNETVLTINPDKKDLFAMTVEDLQLSGYNYASEIKYEANV